MTSTSFLLQCLNYLPDDTTTNFLTLQSFVANQQWKLRHLSPIYSSFYSTAAASSNSRIGNHSVNVLVDKLTIRMSFVVFSRSMFVCASPHLLRYGVGFLDRAKIMLLLQADTCHFSRTLSLRGYLGNDDRDESNEQTFGGEKPTSNTSSTSHNLLIPPVNSTQNYLDFCFAFPRSLLLFKVIPSKFDRLYVLDLSLSNITDEDLITMLHPQQRSHDEKSSNSSSSSSSSSLLLFPFLGILFLNQCEQITGYSQKLQKAVFDPEFFPTSLRRLSVESCDNFDLDRFASDFAAAFRNSKNFITSLDLSFTRLDNSLREQRQLRTRLVPNTVNNSCAELRILQNLLFPFMSLTEETSESSASSTPSFLQELCLDGMFGGGGDLEQISFPSHFAHTNLLRLSLAHCCGVRDICLLPRIMPNLEQLNLENSRELCEEVVDHHFPSVAPPPTRNNSVDDEEERARKNSRGSLILLEEISTHCPHITSLDLSGCVNFGDKTLQVIGESDTMVHNLRDLRLSGLQKITEQGLKHLIPLGGTLKILDISYLSEFRAFHVHNNNNNNNNSFSGEVVIEEIIVPNFLNLEALNLDATCGNMKSSSLRKLVELRGTLKRLGLRWAGKLNVSDVEFLMTSSTSNNNNNNNNTDDNNKLGGCCLLNQLNYLNICGILALVQSKQDQDRVNKLFSERLWRSGESSCYFSLICDSN